MTKAKTGWAGSEGPWCLQRRGDVWAVIGQHKHGHPAVTGIRVAQIDEPHAEANAKGIAAVPEMVEALIDIASTDRAFVEANGIDAAFERIIDRAREALTAAGVKP